MRPKIKSLSGVVSEHIPGQAGWLIFAVTSLGGIGFLALSHRDLRPHPVSASVPPQTFYVSENTSVGLNVERHGDDLVLSWNRDAPAIRAAVTGLLAIQAGDNYENFELGPQDLRAGKFTYRSAANQVNIRLHLYDGNDRRTNDSAVFSLAPEPNRQEGSSPGLMADSGGRGDRSLTANLVPPADRMSAISDRETIQPRSAQSEGTAIQLPEPPSLDSSWPTAETSPFTEPLSLAPPAVAPGSDEQGAAKAPTQAAGGSMPVIGEAPQVPPIRRFVTAIPLVKRFLHNSDFAPPTPSLSPLPEIPEGLRQGLKREVSVDVKVFVNAAGDVQYAELLTDGTGRDRELAALAVFESRRWKFHPARMRGKPRDSEIVLRYRFSPVRGSDVRP